VAALMVETAFISNPSEERRLNDPAHRKRLARAVLSGLVSHFATKPPPGTLIAQRGIDTHVVSRGDTLSDIASRYDVSLSSLRAVNGINGDVLHVGSVLKIPPS
jgi:N-acetylmuramoyl-L-alanine amidase